VAFLTTPIIVSNNNSPLKFETNTIHDYGATVSLCSKELADAIRLVGEERPLGLSVFGTPSKSNIPSKQQYRLQMLKEFMSAMLL
jgi:hypothetical protein